MLRRDTTQIFQTWFHSRQASNCAPSSSRWFDHKPSSILPRLPLWKKVLCLKGHLEPRPCGHYLLACRESFFVAFHTAWVGVYPFEKQSLFTRHCFISPPKHWILFLRHVYWLCLWNIWLDEVILMCFLPRSTSYRVAAYASVLLCQIVVS